MALGDCRATWVGVESDARKAHGITCLHSADWIHGGDAATALLDGGDSRLPAAAEFRTRLLLFLPGIVLFLRWLATGAECADPLCDATGASPVVCPHAAVRWVEPSAGAADPFALGICRDARGAAKPPPQTGGAICGLRAGALLRIARIPTAGDHRRIQFPDSRECVGAGRRRFAGLCDAGQGLGRGGGLPARARSAPAGV